MDASHSSHSTLFWVCSLTVQLVSIDTMPRKRLRATKHRGATTVHSSCVALLLRPGQQLKRALFGRRASEVPLHRCSALARGRDCALPRHGARVFRVSSLRHSTFRAWVTKITHAAESSQNVPTREGNEAQKGKETHDEHVAHCSLMG